MELYVLPDCKEGYKFFPSDFPSKSYSPALSFVRSADDETDNHVKAIWMYKLCRSYMVDFATIAELSYSLAAEFRQYMSDAIQDQICKFYYISTYNRTLFRKTVVALIEQLPEEYQPLKELYETDMLQSDTMVKTIIRNVVNVNKFVPISNEQVTTAQSEYIVEYVSNHTKTLREKVIAMTVLLSIDNSIGSHLTFAIKEFLPNILPMAMQQQKNMLIINSCISYAFMNWLTPLDNDEINLVDQLCQECAQIEIFKLSSYAPENPDELYGTTDVDGLLAHLQNTTINAGLILTGQETLPIQPWLFDPSAMIKETAIFISNKPTYEIPNLNRDPEKEIIYPEPIPHEPEEEEPELPTEWETPGPPEAPLPDDPEIPE